MKINKTHIKDCFLIEPTIFKDERGCFFENFNQKKFEELTGQKISFVQTNQSISKKGVVRGLHIQTGKYAQAKLVRVVSGKVLDVAVDARKNSPTFGKMVTCILSEQNKKQLFIPRGFLHGFATLEDNTIFSYQCDNYYHQKSESGVVYNDSFLNIDWMLKKRRNYPIGKR